MKYALLLFASLMYQVSVGQVDLSGIRSLTNVNGVYVGTFPAIHQEGKSHLVDSLDKQYPNRAYVKFDNLTSAEKDSLVAVVWNRLFREFEQLPDVESIPFKKKSSIFLNLYFNEQGRLICVLYNWQEKGYANQRYEEKLAAFLSSYDFSDLPTGIKWSQCGTRVYKRN